MHIISGKYRGRVIKMPKGIRPTQNKVRKAVFDILGDISGLLFLELFAGSGAVGFEALSAGVKEAFFVESEARCAKAIKESLAFLGCSSCVVMQNDSLAAIKQFWQRKLKFDVIFMDPPYYLGAISRPRALKSPYTDSGSTSDQQEQPLSKKALQSLGHYDILARNGLLVIQHFKKDELPEKEGVLELAKRAGYGDTLISVYRKSE